MMYSPREDTIQRSESTAERKAIRRVADRLTPLVPPRETVRAVALVDLPGAAKRQMIGLAVGLPFGGIGAGVGAVIASHTIGKGADGLPPWLRASPRYIAAVTDTTLLIWAASAGNKPRDLVAAVPRTAIVSSQYGTEHTVAKLSKVVDLHIVFVDATSVTLESSTCRLAAVRLAQLLDPGQRQRLLPPPPGPPVTYS